MRQIIYWTGGVLLPLGAVVYVTGWAFAPYVYLAGAVMFSAMQVTERYEDDNFIVRRLRRQQWIAAFLLVLAGVLMIVLRHNEWVVCLLVAAIIELYTSYRIPHEREKQ